MYVHSVYFTYKSQVPDGAAEALIKDVRQLLAKIPTVRCIEAGRRDPQAQREVNDKDFVVGLTVCFEDRQGHDEYQAHENHHAFLANHKDNWTGVRVYDFIS